MVGAKLHEPDEHGGATIDSPVGLTSDEAHRRLVVIGSNIVRDEALPRWRSYLAKFWSPIAWASGAMPADFFDRREPPWAADGEVDVAAVGDSFLRKSGRGGRWSSGGWAERRWTMM